MRLRTYLTSLSLLLAIILISGCASTQEDIQTFDEREINVKPVKPPKPEPVNMNDINFMVINEDTIGDAQRLINQGVVLIAITTKDYENLSLNMQEIKRYIKSQKQIILYYEQVQNND